MAVTLSLVRKEDYCGATSTLRLINAADGIDLDYYNGWTPGIARGNGLDPVSETINLIISGDDADDLATNVQGLDAKVKEAGWYLNCDVETRALWLRAQMSGESGTRQAALYGIEGSIGESILGPYADAQSVMRRYTLGLTRGPWWESTSDANTRTIALNNLLGAMAAIGGDAIAGDVPARLGRMQISGVSTHTGLTDFWVGFRTSRFGTTANFIPVWDLADAGGTLGTQTTRTGDNSAYPGGAGSFRLTVAYQGNADDEMNTRITMPVDAVAADYNSQRGAFIILLRAKVTSGEWRVRLQDAPEGADADTWRTQDRVSVTSTAAWYMHELGTVRLPPQRWTTPGNYLQKYALRIQAELVSGTGNLYLDALSLIPYSEGAISLHINGTGVQSAGGDGDPAIIRTHPNDEVEGWWYDATIPEASIDVKPLNWGLPVTTTGYVIATGQAATSHVLTDDVEMKLYYWPRWRTLRGED